MYNQKRVAFFKTIPQTRYRKCRLKFPQKCMVDHTKSLFTVGARPRECTYTQTPPPAPAPPATGRWKGPVHNTYGDKDCPNVGCHGGQSAPLTLGECERLCDDQQSGPQKCNAITDGVGKLAAWFVLDPVVPDSNTKNVKQQKK